MTSIVDSEAQFDLRLEQTNVPQALRTALKNSGVNTISSLAYAYGQPGQQIASDDFTQWVRQMDPSATVGGVSSLKRLLFESQTQLLALLKDQVTNPDPASTKKVPQAEKEAKLANLRNRLSGVLIEAEPCHSLLDAACQIYDQNILRYIPLEKCYSRLTELSMTTKNPSKLLEVEASKIVLKDKEMEHEASVQSSYQALESFKRRGLALDFAGVMTFGRHDKYVQMLFSHLNRDPPAGYNRCSVSQLLAADKAAWCSLIEVNTKPRPDATGISALDTKLEEALKSYEVSFTLLPVMSKQVTKPATPAAPPQNRTPAPKGNRKGFNRFKPYYQKGKGKGKGKADQRIPREIREAGGTASTPTGDPICYMASIACEKAPCTDLPPDPTLHQFSIQNYAGGRIRQPRTPNTSAARVVTNLIKLNSGSLSCQKGCFVHDSHMLTSDSFFSLQTQHDQSGKHKHNKQNKERRETKKTKRKNMGSLCRSG